MLTRINEIAARLWDTGWFYGGWYLFANALWFVAITLLALAVPPTIIAAMAFIVPLGVALRFLVRYVWWPTGPIAVALNEFVKRVTKANLARFVVSVMAFEVGWGLFVAYWPIETAPDVLVPFVGAVIAAILFGIGSGGKKGMLKALSGLFALVAIGLLLFFIPNVRSEAEEALGVVMNGAPAANGSDGTPAGDNAVRYTVTLRGHDTPSEVAFVLGDGSRPAGTRCTFEGPTGTEVLFDDGSTGSINVTFGTKSGPVRFLGPVGQTAGAVCRLP